MSASATVPRQTAFYRELPISAHTFSHRIRPLLIRVIGSFHVVVMVCAIVMADRVASAQSNATYLPLSLETMVRDAHRIVIGEVRTVSEVMEEHVLDGIRSPFLVRKVTLINVEAIKGPKQQQIVINHYASMALPVETGQRLLWFLGKPTEVGFDPILGKLSGDFEIVISPEHPGLRFAVNRVQNRGLWDNSPSGVLWRDDLTRRTVEAKLVDLKVKEKFLATILEYGDNRCQPRPIPLDLIRAAAHAQLAAANTAPARPR